MSVSVYYTEVYAHKLSYQRAAPDLASVHFSPSDSEPIYTHLTSYCPHSPNGKVVSLWRKLSTKRDALLVTQSTVGTQHTDNTNKHESLDRQF